MLTLYVVLYTIPHTHLHTNNSVVEQREASIAWHYRDCDLGHGAWQAKQLHVSLLQVARGLPITVYAGDKVSATTVTTTLYTAALLLSTTNSTSAVVSLSTTPNGISTLYATASVLTPEV
jgi:trehalose-6-phosphatase